MALRWFSTVVDCADPIALGRWWAEALDWQVVFEADDEIAIVPRWYGEQAASTPFHQRHPGLVFGVVPEPKTAKNRLHLDLAPHLDQDRDAEIQRLIDLGATYADVGQGPEVGWTVLADPEGNEFCVLSSRDL